MQTQHTRVTIETARAEVESTPRLALCLKYGLPFDTPVDDRFLYDIWLGQQQEALLAEQAEQAEAAKQLELF